MDEGLVFLQKSKGLTAQFSSEGRERLQPHRKAFSIFQADGQSSLFFEKESIQHETPQAPSPAR